MKTGKLMRVLAFLLAMLTLVTSFAVVGSAAKAGTEEEIGTTEDLWSAMSYRDYLAKYGEKPNGSATVTVLAAEEANRVADATTATGVEVRAEGGKQGLYLPDAGRVAFRVNVPSEGRYVVRLTYYSVGDKSTAIERMLYIDGAIPFKESGYLTMTKTWRDVYPDENNRVFETDAAGNDIRPGKEQVKDWNTYLCADSTGYNIDPFQYYFTAGEHTIALAATREEVLLYAIELIPADSAEVKTLTYAEYLQQHAGAANASGFEPIYIQAEQPISASDQILYPVGDRTSAITYPQDASQIKLNSIGGTGWQVVGQWIRYEVEVPQDGFYSIATRFKQDTLQGMFTSRRIRIDGVIPFEEANYLQFNYHDSWQVGELNAGGAPLTFYMEAGKHVLELEVVLGSMSEILRDVSTIMDNLNNAYMKFLMITGASPDEYRTYNFKTLVPTEIQILRDSAEKLSEIANKMQEITGRTGSHIATLNKVALMAERMGMNPEDEIAKNMSNLKSYLGTLGTWLYTTERQPLMLDYILIQPIGTELPEADASFLQAAWFEIKQFFMSFFTDYNSVSSTDGDATITKESVSIWYTGGRDRAQIIRNLIDNEFTPQSGIPVELKLVAGGVLQSVLAGVGPDVAFLGSADTINWAIRSALTPLTTFIEAEPQVKDTFNPESFVPLTLYGETYGLPSQMDFFMMFYRIDIFKDRDLTVPKTWDDFYALLPILQANYMDVAFPGHNSGLNLLLYQMGGKLFYDPTEDEQYFTDGAFDYAKYTEAVGLQNAGAPGGEKTLEGVEINLGSNVALSAFEELMGMFESYRFPLTYDFATRFRTGEMPIGILTYNTYNTLSVYASELRGMWEMVPLPGWKDDATGEVNHCSTLTVNALVMPRGNEEGVLEDAVTKNAWELMKWFVSTPTQAKYGTELQAVMGSAAKYNTANIEAIKQMSWTTAEANNIAEQMKYLRGVPEVPGSYIVDRYVSFAFLAVYNDSATSTGADPAEALQDYLTEINKELTRKRKEFELPYIDVSAKK